MLAKKPMKLGRVGILLVMIAAAGCASPAAIEETAVEMRPEWAGQAVPHENLNSVLWVQTSVEYAALAEQSYRLAERVLDEALADPMWTASLEQSAMGTYEQLPAAVVLDVDETVLDNSAYQARLILDAATYSSESWNEWARESAAPAVPGALAFTQYADRLGVTVIYLTNRGAGIEEATRRNLMDLGFPLSDEVDVILTRGEKPAWSASDKTPRREFVAEQFRILLLIGDNLGDFLTDIDEPPAQRKQALAPYQDYWGTRWIMLPNPQYGSWEGALIEFDYAAPAEDQLQRKLESLETKR